VDGYTRLYPGAYAPPAYVTAVKQVVGALQDRYGVNRRVRKVPSEPDDDEVATEGAQAALGFEP
jgi:hypothetical protein